MLYPAELRALGTFMIPPGPFPCRALTRGQPVAARVEAFFRQSS